jgi:hypothetical protein
MVAAADRGSEVDHAIQQMGHRLHRRLPAKNPYSGVLVTSAPDRPPTPGE